MGLFSSMKASPLNDMGSLSVCVCVVTQHTHTHILNTITGSGPRSRALFDLRLLVPVHQIRYLKWRPGTEEREQLHSSSVKFSFH